MIQTATDAELLEPVADILRPRERLSVAEWADRHRVLNERFAAEPGPFRIARTPYLSEPYQACADPRVTRVILVKSAQVGGTELLNNVLLYTLVEEPRPVLYALPTEDDAKDEATGRLRCMIEDCPATRGFIPHANFASGEIIRLRGPRTIYMASAAAPRTMVRKAAGIVFFDEIDNLEQAAGRLGQHLALSEERITTFGHHGRIVAVSTPSVPEAAAWQAWLQSDRRHYHVPCPHCGTYQVLRFDRIKWPPDAGPDEILAGDLATYQCAECGETIAEQQRFWMIRRGVWIPETQKPAEKLPLDDREIVTAAGRMRNRWRPALAGQAPVTRQRGYRVWSVHSPWRPFSAIAARFLRSREDREQMRVFTTSWLGEPFVEITSRPVKRSALAQRRVDSYARDTVPHEVQTLTIGVDTQDACFYYEVRGWGYHGRTFLIREGIADTFGDLDELLRTTWPTADGTRQLRPLCLAIDSGGNRTKEVYEYARNRAGIVYPVKGHRSAAWSVMPRKIHYDLPTRLRAFVLLYHVNTEYYKDSLAAAMHKPLDGPEAFLLHRETSDEYLAHLTSEHKIEKPRRPGAVTPGPQSVWVPKASHRPNHWWDAQVYNVAIADHKRLTVLRPPEEKARPPVKTRRPQQSSREFLARRARRAAMRRRR